MFEIVDLPKTPRIARRLIEMSEIGGLTLDPGIRDLARQDSEHLRLLTRLPFDTTESEINTIQFLNDRYGRAVVLEDLHKKANRSALAYVWLKNEFPVLIVTNLLTQNRWVSLILKIWPDKKVNIFGKKKFQGTDLASAVGCAVDQILVTDEPVDGCDFYIAKPSELYKGELLKKTRFAQVIVNHVADVGSVTKATLSNIEHVCIETAASIVFVNLQQCVSHARSDDDIRFENVKWDSHNLAIKSATQILFPNLTYHSYMVGEYGHLDHNLDENGITLDRSKWLPIMNICPHLVK